MWHVSSRSGVATLRTAIHLLLTYLLSVSCFSKIQIDFTFLVPAHPGIPGQRAVKRVCVCVCVCVCVYRERQRRSGRVSESTVGADVAVAVGAEMSLAGVLERVRGRGWRQGNSCRDPVTRTVHVQPRRRRYAQSLAVELQSVDV